MAVRGNTQLHIHMTYYNGEVDDFTSSANWSSSNTSIATVGNGSTAGLTAGVSAGTMDMYASLAGIPTVTGEVCEPTAPSCSTSNPEGEAGGTSQVPTSLKVLSVVVLPNGSGPPNGCPPSSNYGIEIDIKYQVLDQEVPPVPIQSAGMTPYETGTLFTGQTFKNNVGPIAGYPTSSATTASDGTFHDVPFGYCQNLPISNPGLTATQNLTMLINQTSYPVRSQSFTVTAPGSASFGHGTITNKITSPGSGSDISAKR